MKSGTVIIGDPSLRIGAGNPPMEVFIECRCGELLTLKTNGYAPTLHNCEKCERKYSAGVYQEITVGEHSLKSGFLL